MLPGAGLGDQPGLAHALGEQPLPEHLVGLVRAAVQQVLALQIDVARQVAAAGQRRRPAGIIGEQIVELRAERGSSCASRNAASSCSSAGTRISGT